MVNNNMYDYYASVDVESIGLHGEAFAWAVVVFNKEGEPVSSRLVAIDPDICKGTTADREWITNNIEEIPFDQGLYSTRYDLIQEFRAHVQQLKNKFKNIVFMAECPYPVEFNLIKEAFPSGDNGIFYPFIDISSVMIAAGMNPMATYPRLSHFETPAHCPQADAFQSAGLFFEALERINKP